MLPPDFKAGFKGLVSPKSFTSLSHPNSISQQKKNWCSYSDNNFCYEEELLHRSFLVDFSKYSRIICIKNYTWMLQRLLNILIWFTFVYATSICFPFLKTNKIDLVKWGSTISLLKVLRSLNENINFTKWNTTSTKRKFCLFQQGSANPFYIFIIVLNLTACTIESFHFF